MKVVIFHSFNRVFHNRVKGVGRMFLGTFSHSIDQKGRAFIPAKFRDELGEDFVVTRGLDPCLCVYPKNEWEKLCERLSAFPDAKSRAVRRFFFSNATDNRLDSQGRLLLPQNLREDVGIEKDISIVGNGTCIEIWSSAEFAREKSLEDPHEIEAIMLGLEG